MRTNRTQVLGAIAIGALVVAGSSAYTGTGLSTSGQAASAQFVGGTVSQAVSGATLQTVDYAFADSTKTRVNAITLTFADGADGKAVSATPSGGSGGTFSCAAVATDDTSACSYTPAAAEAGYLSLASLSVTVS